MFGLSIIGVVHTLFGLLAIAIGAGYFTGTRKSRRTTGSVSCI
jgi:hypothetical protein